MLKDLLNIGLGSALLVKEKVEEELEKLAQKGKISKEEAKEIVEKVKEKAIKKEEEAKEKLKKMIKDILDELNIATKDDIEELKKKIEK